MNRWAAGGAAANPRSVPRPLDAANKTHNIPQISHICLPVNILLYKQNVIKLKNRTDVRGKTAKPL